MYENLRSMMQHKVNEDPMFDDEMNTLKDAVGIDNHLYIHRYRRRTMRMIENN